MTLLHNGEQVKPEGGVPSASVKTMELSSGQESSFKDVEPGNGVELLSKLTIINLNDLPILKLYSINCVAGQLMSTNL